MYKIHFNFEDFFSFDLSIHNLGWEWIYIMRINYFGYELNIKYILEKKMIRLYMHTHIPLQWRIPKRVWSSTEQETLHLPEKPKKKIRTFNKQKRRGKTVFVQSPSQASKEVV